jgi:hypothetical protein
MNDSIDIQFVDASNWLELSWYNSGGTRATNKAIFYFQESTAQSSLSALKYTASFYGNLKFAIMDIFIMTDQPFTCPLCGARAEIIREFKVDDLSAQLCKCADKDCQYLFIEQEDVFLETKNKLEY